MLTSDKNTILENMIAVGDGHKLYTQLWGNKDAEQTILFLHGGPGSGCNDSHKSMFDAHFQKVLFIDQRGAGNSTPSGSLAENNSQKLVNDIAKVAEAYDIDSFIVTGGSWGSTLALLFAIEFPEMVDTLVIRGIFTARKQEIDFLDKGKMKTVFPDVWDELLEATPKEHHKDPVAYHLKNMFGDDTEQAKKSAFAVDNLEMGVMRLDDRRKLDDFEAYDPNGITIEYHFLKNGCFIEKNYIFDNADKISCPVFIVQGRYDQVCPPETAWELHKLLKNSSLHWTTAGHLGSDRNTWEVTKAILATLTL